MSIDSDMNQIEELLCDIRDQIDNETQDFLKEISVLNDEVELLKAEIDRLDDRVTDLLIINKELESQVAHLEVEIIEAVMQNKRL